VFLNIHQKREATTADSYYFEYVQHLFPLLLSTLISLAELSIQNVGLHPIVSLPKIQRLRRKLEVPSATVT
jgi:hypothetical protein